MSDHAVAGGNSQSRRHYVAPWHLAYLILGVITSGLLRFLLPLMVATTTHDLGHIAYIVGAYNLRLLPALCWGWWQSAISSSARSSLAGLYCSP